MPSLYSEFGSASRPVFLSRAQLYAVCAMLFFLVATNAHPLWWNSGVPCTILALYLLFSRSGAQIRTALTSANGKTLTFSLVGLTLFTLISTAVTPNMGTAEATLERNILPLLVYFSLAGICFRPREINYLLISLGAGITIPLTRGLFAFYREWGIPDLSTLLWARYNEQRMFDYMNQTFGNVGHMGDYIVLVAPMFVLLLARFPLNRSIKLGIAGGLVLLVFSNLIISGARTAIITAVLALCVILVRMGLKGGMFIGGALVLASLIAVYQGASYYSSDDLISRFLPTATESRVDESFIERYLSIQEGIDQFYQRPLTGIGPGMSGQVNTYTAPHQSIVLYASELGIFGGLFFVLLNLVVFYQVGRNMLRTSSNNIEDWRLLWLIGPGCWLFSGFIGGLLPNQSLALVWIGITHAMLALSTSVVRADVTARP